MIRKFGFIEIAGALLMIGLLAGCEVDGGITTPGGVPLESLALCCNTARGGGSILITEPSGATHKATFGFQMVCRMDATGNPVVTGQFEYQDHAAKDAKGKPMNVSIHGVANKEGLVIGECTPTKGGFTGTYKPQPEGLGEGGTFRVAVEDKGKPGPSDGDTFTIYLESGVFAGYYQSGTLAGGNVKTF